MSSAESLLLMFDQCPQATRLGATTAGSSGNPQIIDTGIGVRVSLPRWIDLKPDQTPLEGAGVQPDAPVDVTPEQFERGEDPVLDAAFERLRSIPVGQRQPGHRRPGATANGASTPNADQNDDLAGDADEVEE
jgi:C-terminal processing protease CtpA/Prc